MNSHSTYRIAYCTIFFGGIIAFYFMSVTFNSNYRIWGKDYLDFAITGQFGDFIGGVVGTLFSLSGTLLIFLTFQEQKYQNHKESIRANIDGFEATFFELIKLHKENINELTYTKYDKIETFENGEQLSSMRTANNRKVFRMIFREFIECFNEIKNYPIYDVNNEILTKNYEEKLKKIIDNNGRNNIDLFEMAYIDIAYSIIYYGIGVEGQSILKSNFSGRYNDIYINSLLDYIKLKPRQENKQLFKSWEELIKLPKEQIINKIAEYNTNKEGLLSNSSPKDDTTCSLEDNNYIKYYGGHQHRLGHYFRHLFQSYKYLNTSTILNPDQKYFYGKMLRAQLSTYEQALLFINSISSLGMKWEFTPDTSQLTKPNSKPSKDIIRTDLITTYHLIKNLPGTHIENFVYKTYYPNIKYETEE